jgi:hypothetical protein
MKNLLCPSWQKPYQEAVLECDPHILEGKIMAAESAIFLRLQELASIDGLAPEST